MSGISGLCGISGLSFHSSFLSLLSFFCLVLGSFCLVIFVLMVHSLQKILQLFSLRESCCFLFFFFVGGGGEGGEGVLVDQLGNDSFCVFFIWY